MLKKEVNNELDIQTTSDQPGSENDVWDTEVGAANVYTSKSKRVMLTSEFSSNEDDLPPLKALRTSQSKVEGTDNVSKIKSKRGMGLKFWSLKRSLAP